MAYKIPESVLVVIHTPDLQVLLIRRADAAEDFWQSVTGSKDSLGEALAATAAREVRAAGCATGGWRMFTPFTRSGSTATPLACGGTPSMSLACRYRRAHRWS